MNCFVEVRYTGADWCDLLADMRSWFDRRQIEPEEFVHPVLDRGVAVRVRFSDGDHAAAFASAFSGRLEHINLDSTVGPARGTIARPAEEGASTLDDPTTFGEPLTASAKVAVTAGVSLMITRQQRAELRERGYTDEQIRHMKPDEAHRVVGLIRQQPPSASAGRRRSPG